jgi:hypothetical protein
MGAEVPHQTLPDPPLNLPAQEQKDLIAFLHSLTGNRARSQKNRAHCRSLRKNRLERTEIWRWMGFGGSVGEPLSRTFRKP